MVKLLITCLLLSAVSAYETGAPEGACDLLTPNHGAEAQNSESNPYKLSVSTKAITPGEQVNVTLISDDKVNFKGFLVVAKQPETGTPVGTMEPLFDFSKPFVVEGLCSGAGITHSKGWTEQPYHLLPFVWKSPSDFEGLVSFHATAVQDKATFWVDFEGDQIVISTTESEVSTPETEEIEAESNDETEMNTMESTNSTTAATSTTTEVEFEEVDASDDDMLPVNSTSEIFTEDNDTNSTDPGINDDDDDRRKGNGVLRNEVTIWMFLYATVGCLMTI